MSWHVSPLVYPVSDSLCSWTWVCFLPQYGEMFSHCFFKWEFIFLSLFSLNSYNVNTICLILSTKCLKLSLIFCLIFFFLVLRSGDFHYSVFLFLLLNINVFIFIGGWLLYSAVVVLPHIDMNPPWVHMCSPSWGPAPPSGSAGAPAGTAVCVSLLICPLNHPICWLICCIFHVSYCILPL